MQKRKRFPTQRTKNLFIPKFRSIYDEEYDLTMKELSDKSVSWMQKSFVSYKADVNRSPSLHTRARFTALVDSLALKEKEE
tara:strand:- start:71 stop:313 length:243 start_codon:yes stop_codon:yes gene_type:complete